MNGIGLSGAHGVGKTCLAEAYAKQTGIAFIASEASSVIKNAGFDPALDYSFEDRLGLQNLILDSAEKSFELAKGRPFISDRTPLDFLTYLLTRVGRNNVSDRQFEELMRYQDRCLDVIKRHFGLIMIIQPGIVAIAREGKGSQNKAYIQHFNRTLIGLCCLLEQHVHTLRLKETCLSIDKRLAAVGIASMMKPTLPGQTHLQTGSNHQKTLH